MKRESLLKMILAALIVLVITQIVDHYVDNLGIENCIITSRLLLKATILSLIIVLLIIPFSIKSLTNKRKKFKKYSDYQIRITKDISNNKIKCANDFLFQYFKISPQHKPLNNFDDKKNLLILDNINYAKELLRDFKTIMKDITKYNYIELKTDTSIELFTYLKYNDIYQDDIEIYHDMAMAFEQELKQKIFIIKNKRKLKKLIRKKRLPKNKEKT
jgi:hypothetical protein